MCFLPRAHRIGNAVKNYLELSNAFLRSVTRETEKNFSSGSVGLWTFGSQYPPFILRWRQLIILPFPLKSTWYPPPERILHPPPPVIDPLKFLSSYRKGLRSIAALLPLLGVTWLLGFFIHWSEVLAYLFIILNSTQVLTVLCALQLLPSIKFTSLVFPLILLGFGVLYLPWLLGWPGIFQLNSYSFGVSLMQNIVFLVVALWIGGLCTKTSTLRTLSRIADFLYLFVAVSLYLLQ